MNNKVWIYKNIDNSISKSLMDRYGFNKICADVLQNRTEIVGGNVDNLFKRVLYNLHNPFLLNDMDRAVVRIEKAVMLNEKITVYGDYDADGVTSTSILYMFLKENGANVDYYIPNRFSDGYGMNADSVKKIADSGTKLIITVDNGIAAANEIEYAKELGLDVIVTDHHECPDVIPDCCAVINPKRKDSTYPFSELAGVGIAFKLVSALNKGSLESIIKKYILIAAIGTIADVVPLTDENRAIVTMGLKMVAVNKNCGVRSLLEVSGINEIASVSDFAFGVVPRINAAGRMENASCCVELFAFDNVQKCKEIAERLNELNTKRQNVEKEITESAFNIIEENKLYHNNVIVVYNEGWNHGVIGIVASKISERYYKPCIVLTDDNGVAKGSGRSVSDFNLYDSLSFCSDFLLKFGGHSQAAGMSLEIENIEAFRNKINEYAKNVLNGQGFSEKIHIDCLINGKSVDIPVIKGLEILEPYGVGNPKPTFAMTDVKVLSKHQLSDGKHLKLRLLADETEFDALGFSMGDYYCLIYENDTVDIAGCLDINCYKGYEKPQIILKDIKRIKHS